MRKPAKWKVTQSHKFRNGRKDHNIKKKIKVMTILAVLRSVTVVLQAPPSIGFPRQEYWSELSFPSPGDLANPEANLHLPQFRQTLYHLSHQGIPQSCSSPLFKYRIMIKGHNDWVYYWSGCETQALTFVHWAVLDFGDPIYCFTAAADHGNS